MVLSYSLCETVGIDGENVRMLEVNRGRPVAEQEHEEVHGLRVVVEVARQLVSNFILATFREMAETYSQNMVWSGRPL